MSRWLKENKFKAHTIAFMTMALSSMGMLLIRHNVETGVLVWGLVGIFALANVLAVFIR